MNPKKIAALMDTLILTCSRQFRFNPRRVASDMRYKGTQGEGKNLVHVFKDIHTQSQIDLDSRSMAILREQHGDTPHWDDAEKKRYCQTDAEIDAEIAAKQARLEATKASALYQDHREHLLSHYKGSPHYQEGRPTAREVARDLIAQLSAAQDARLTEFSAQMQTNDPEQLSHLLLAPCHIERAAWADKNT
ncbi:hypothetical protein [Undibacterium flavidum]|uniref:Uncharacterized protein n=1 Tax=Undibacterium flavidum TaxID=2762297 RepID=A0ABR6Y7A8_9BURK|nr:hypothetical protein [Undibacterium flavidum]MBC3872496.1 hypothetical protein [Undibacterium flavidum]